MNRKLANVFIGVLGFVAALSTAAVFTATDAQAKKISVKKGDNLFNMEASDSTIWLNA